jgi:hypothetical protein
VSGKEENFVYRNYGIDWRWRRILIFWRSSSEDVMRSSVEVLWKCCVSSEKFFVCSGEVLSKVLAGKWKL